MAGIKGPERVQAEDRVRRTYLRPQVRDSRLSPEYRRVLDDLTLDMRRENTREITARRLVERLPEETRRTIETRATEERLDLDTIRLGEPELIFFLSRISTPEVVDEARISEESPADPLRLLRTISDGRIRNEVRESGQLPTLSILADEQQLVTADPRIAEHPPEEVRRILELLRENPELRAILLERVGLEELRGLHGWELLRYIVRGLLEYRAELGRVEFERRFGRGLPAREMIEAARLAIIYDRLDVSPRFMPEWRMIRAAYLRDQRIRDVAVRFIGDRSVPEGNQFLAGLRVSQMTQLTRVIQITEDLFTTTKFNNIAVTGQAYLDYYDSLVQVPTTIEKIMGTLAPKSHIPPCGIAAIIDVQGEVEVFKAIFEAALRTPEENREEPYRNLLENILDREIPETTTKTESRPTAHEQLFKIIETPQKWTYIECEAEDLLLSSENCLYHALKYFSDNYGFGRRRSATKSAVGRLISNILRDFSLFPEDLPNVFRAIAYYLATELIQKHELRINSRIRELITRALNLAEKQTALASFADAITFSEDVRQIAADNIIHSSILREPLIWEARGQAALLLVIRRYFKQEQADVAIGEIARRAAEELRKQLGEQNKAKPFIHYLPAFVPMRLGGEYRDRALDEFKTALLANGGRGLLTALDIVQGIARGEIYTDVENILREIDLAELEPEIRLLGHILRSERLQKQYQEDLFALGRMLLAQMPTDLLKGLTDLIDIGQYEEVSLRVERWLKSKLDDISGFGEAPSGAVAARSDS